MITSSEQAAPRRGRFITFEGVDGAGKSTQIRLLAERLRGLHAPVTLTREPGGSPNAEAVRELLVDGAAERWDALSEVLLFYAARRDHVERRIRPALARGDFVLCDRFADSSRAYQGHAGGIPAALLDTLDAAVLGGLAPDLTLILDVPAAKALERLRGRRRAGRFEARGEAWQEQVRAAFQAIARAAPHRCRLIDASQTPDDVAEAVWKEVLSLLPEQARAKLRS